MRVLLLALALLGSLAQATALPLGPFILHDDGSVESVACVDADIMAPTGSGARSIQPRCALVSSGSALTFRLGTRVHEMGSDLDRRFLPPASRCFETWGAAPESGDVPVSFDYDGMRLRASAAGGPWRDCDVALDRAQSTAERAVLQVYCVVHPRMKAMIVVT